MLATLWLLILGAILFSTIASTPHPLIRNSIRNPHHAPNTLPNVESSPPGSTGLPQISKNPHRSSTKSKNLRKINRLRQTRITIANRKSHDKHDHVSYGDSVYQKSPAHLRALFQNTHGLTYSSSGEDYKYYHVCLQDLGVNVSGLAETNTA